MFVVAKPGIKVPFEKNPRDYITEATPVTVPDTHYYLSAYRVGDLVDAPVKPAKGEASL